MKLLGMFLVTASGFLAGYMASRKLKERLDMLLDIDRLFSLLKTEIAFSSKPISEIVSRSDTKLVYRAKKSEVFYENTLGELKKSSEILIKNKEDRKLFQEFLSCFGFEDTSGQLEQIELYSGLFAPQISKAREDCEKKRKIYLCLGVFSAIALCSVLA